jgi:hypothetical protein
LKRPGRSRNRFVSIKAKQGKDFRLKHANPGETLGLKGEDERRAKEALTMGI